MQGAMSTNTRPKKTFSGAPSLVILDAEELAGVFNVPDPKVVEEEIQQEITENHRCIPREPSWKQIEEEAEQLRRRALEKLR